VKLNLSKTKIVLLTTNYGLIIDCEDVLYVNVKVSCLILGFHFFLCDH